MTRTEIYEQVQRLIAEQDLFAASAFVLGLDETQAVAEAFENLVLDCYHVAKSIEQVLHFGSAGVHYCLAPARWPATGRTLLPPKRSATPPSAWQPTSPPSRGPAGMSLA